jgi:SNF2 family DNA or RNA helicase
MALAVAPSVIDLTGPSPPASPAAAHPTAKPTLKRLMSEAIETVPGAGAAKFLKREAPADTPRIFNSTFLSPGAAVNYQQYLRHGVKLMDHQVENLERLVTNVRTQTLPSSLLVSDDPGLGKTLTAIAAMCALRSAAAPQHGDFKVLVVAPKSVALQWRDEILKFSRTIEPNVSVNALDANARITILSYEKVSFLFKQVFERIVEEGVADWHMRQGVKSSPLFKPGHFKMVVFDEIHKARNSKTLMYQALLHVAPAAAGHAEYPRLGLSGTPIVNRPTDMASIGAVLKFGKPFDDQKGRFYERDILLAATSRGFEKTLFIRHLKEDVLELPRLVKHTKRLTLNDKEIEQHQRWLANLISVAQLTNAKRATFVELLTALMRVRQVGIHPDLPALTMRLAELKAMPRDKSESDSEAESEDGELSDESDESSEESESEEKSERDDSDEAGGEESAEEDDTDYSDGDARAETLIRELAASWEASTKFSWVTRKLKEQKDSLGGVLIFSSFSAPLRALRYVLKEQCGLDAELYSGSRSATQRAAAVKSFLAGTTRVMLLTYGSGGLGLNLCPAATVVIHLDAPWAPASVRQATDRAHRRGCTSNVTEVTLSCTDSSDHYILDNVHVIKQGHMSSLDRLAASLRVRAKNADGAMNKKNILRLVDWFLRRRYNKQAPQREA